MHGIPCISAVSCLSIISAACSLQLSLPDPGRFGGFCDNVDLLDAAVFRLSATEAAAIDPQQRMLLEQSFLALQDAEGHLGRAVPAASGVVLAALVLAAR